MSMFTITHSMCVVCDCDRRYKIECYTNGDVSYKDHSNVSGK